MDDPSKKHSTDDVSQVQQTPANGVSISGSINKEVQRPVSDFVRHSESAPVLDQEVKNAGVEVVSDKPKLTPEHEAVGIKHSLENNVPKLEPTGEVKLPLTGPEAEAIVAADKNKVGRDIGEHKENIYFMPSAFGLANLVLKHLKKIKNKLSFKK